MSKERHLRAALPPGTEARGGATPLGLNTGPLERPSHQKKENEMVLPSGQGIPLSKVGFTPVQHCLELLFNQDA